MTITVAPAGAPRRPCVSVVDRYYSHSTLTQSLCGAIRYSIWYREPSEDDDALVCLSHMLAAAHTLAPDEQLYALVTLCLLSPLLIGSGSGPNSLLVALMSRLDHDTFLAFWQRVVTTYDAELKARILVDRLASQ